MATIDLRLGDCLGLMKTLGDKQVDCVITDPPYGIGENSKKNASRTNLAVAKDYGETGVACVNLNRNFIGMEISEQYFAIAKRRIKQAQEQIAMELK